MWKGKENTLGLVWVGVPGASGSHRETLTGDCAHCYCDCTLLNADVEFRSVGAAKLSGTWELLLFVRSLNE